MSGTARTSLALPVALAVALLGAGCALIAGVPDLELAPGASDGGADARDPSPADGATSADGGDGATSVDAGPRCRFEDAFERDVTEIGSLNVRGTCSSVGFTADEKVAAVASFVNGLGATAETSWALFTLVRTTSPTTYENQVQQLVAGSAALRDDGLAIVVSPDTDGRGALKEYARPRLDAVFAASGEVAALASFESKRNPAYQDADTVFIDGRRTAGAALRVFRLARSGGALEGAQEIDGLPADAGTPVPSRDGAWLYVSVCNAGDAGTRCTPYRAKRSAGTTFGAAEPLGELGDFRPRWLSTDGCRLYGTRQQRPAFASKLPR